MISRILARLLEDLEAQLQPDAEPIFIQVVFTDPDGSKEDGPRITVPTHRGPGATMPAMNALAKRLVRLEARFAPVEQDYLRDPRKRHRVTITNIGKQLSLATSTCQRRLSADGLLFEIVRLDGTREGLSDADFERFVESFPFA